MLKLTLAAGGRLEIPAHAIIAVMKPADGSNPSAIMYDMGAGLQIDQLGDQYGWLKKTANDASAFDNPLEVTVVEHWTVGDGDQAMQASGHGKMLFSRSRIVGRRDATDGGPAKGRLYVRLDERVITVNTVETLDEMDGVEAEAAPASPVAVPVLKAGE